MRGKAKIESAHAGILRNQYQRIGDVAPTLIARLVWCCVLAAQIATAQASDRPSTLLEDADLDQARRFAINAALDRGWTIRGSSDQSTVFERTLAALPGETEYDSEPATMLRIMADFVRSDDGTVVHLQAEEIRNPGESGQTMVDVTQLYRDNLMNALWSLRMKWETRDYVPPPDPGPLPTKQSRIQTSGEGQSPEVGVWAYYAEQFARDHGCVLSDRGAVLESSGAETERHRVHCDSGQAISVTCNSTSCWDGR